MANRRRNFSCETRQRQQVKQSPPCCSRPLYQSPPAAGRSAACRRAWHTTMVFLGARAVRLPCIALLFCRLSVPSVHICIPASFSLPSIALTSLLYLLLQLASWRQHLRGDNTGAFSALNVWHRHGPCCAALRLARRALPCDLPTWPPAIGREQA